MILVTKNHMIAVESVPSACETSGHRDLIVTCSCGMIQRLNHGKRETASQTILYHRLTALEAVVGMKINIEWKAGS